MDPTAHGRMEVLSNVMGCFPIPFCIKPKGLQCFRPLFWWCILIQIFFELFKSSGHHTSSFCKNSCSDMMGTPKLSAFVFLLGPILSPAIKKLVFEDIEEDTLPPLSSINFFNSFLLTVSNTPETTKICPFS